MDPNETLRSLVDALCLRDVVGAQEQFDNLAGWLDDFGFAPANPYGAGKDQTAINL
jgi:hypothetical protein